MSDFKAVGHERVMDDRDDDRDAALLVRWHHAGDEAAFETIVRRHIDLVFNAARRQLSASSDCYLCDDVTQAVFFVLSQKPRAAMKAKSLPAWLHLTTRYAVANTRKLSARRRRHEASAAAQRREATMQDDAAGPDPLLPVLDEAIASLSETDRATVVLRHLQGHDLAAVAAAIGVTPDAARKRSDRALGKLRHFFERRGVMNVTAVGVVATLATARESASAAPINLITGSVATATQGLTATSAAIPIAKGAVAMMTWTQIKAVAVVVAAVFVGGVGVQTARTLLAQENMPSTTLALAAATSTRPVDASLFRGMLANGVGIELLGVSEHPSQEKSWWNADGSPLDAAPYATFGVKISPRDGFILREFAIKATTPADASGERPTLRWTVAGSNASGSGSVSDGRRTIADNGIAAAIPDRPATIRCEVAAGAFAIIGSMPKPISKTSFRDSDVAVHPVRGDETGVEIDIETNVNAFEVIADVRTVTGGSAWHSAGRTTRNAGLMTFGFKEARNDISEIRVRRRKFDQWIEFRNVSVHAGTTTAVEISTSDDAASPADVAMAVGTDDAIGISFDRPEDWHTDGPNLINPKSGQTDLIFTMDGTDSGTQSTLKFSGDDAGGLATIDTTTPANATATASRIFTVDGAPARLTAYRLPDSGAELLTIQTSRGRRFYTITMVFPASRHEHYLALADRISASVRFLK